MQIHTITRHMRCEQIGKRRDTSVDIMAYRGRPNIGMPIMRRIIQPIIKSSRRMKRKVAIFICIVLLGSSCYEPGERGLFLNNKSGYELTCFVADEINSGFSYPDTLLHADPNPFCIANSILESGWIFGRKGNWESILSVTHSGVLSVYLFKQEDVDNLGWKYLSEHNGYLVRYDLRLDDLRLLKDTLYYPPTTAMRNIHMFPPYEKVKTH